MAETTRTIPDYQADVRAFHKALVPDQVADRPTLLAALEVLRNVEWSATEDHPEGGTYPCCPICEGGDPDRPGTPEGYEGHRDDCELDAVIQEIETVLMIAGDEQPQVPVVTRWDATIREAAQAAIESAPANNGELREGENDESAALWDLATLVDRYLYGLATKRDLHHALLRIHEPARRGEGGGE